MRRVVRLGCQHHALRNAEAVLFINDGKGEVFVFYRLLKNGVRADKNVYGTVRQPHERGLARASLLPARQDGDVDRDPCKHPLESRKMLASANFGGCHPPPLRSRLPRRKPRPAPHTRPPPPPPPPHQP